MEVCLQDPQHGYYTQGNGIGREGDFITAPEISPLFGELIAAWLMMAWETLGRPPFFRLVELGPGKGTLMQDILRTSRVLPEFHKGCLVHLIELSPSFQKIQQETLQKEKGTSMAWHTTLEEVPEDYPLFFIANEFFDALPFHQFFYTGEEWRERRVGWREPEGLTWELSPAPLGETLLKKILKKKEAQLSPYKGACGEVSPESLNQAQALRHRLLSQGGAGLIIDYGYEQGYGDTFQALSRHEYVSVLSHPGEVDLTAHVDFGALSQVFSSFPQLSVYGPLSQHEFLRDLHIEERARIVKKTASNPAKIDMDVHRLVDLSQMGGLFKVLGILSSK
jgi:SAM-dependent MidA family methyltransferase